MNHISPATDILADGDAARSDRNAERLRDLAAARRMTMEMMARLSDGAAIRLMGVQANAFDEVKDPYLTMSRLQLGLCRIVALEQRLDESDEMRARRLAEEEAERQSAAKRAADAAARAEREATTAAAQRKADSEETLIRKAVRKASFDMDAKMVIAERESLIDGLFISFDDYRDYADDPAAIVVEMCCDLAVEIGCIDPMEPGGLTDLPKDATHEQRYDAMKALAQSYLDAVSGRPPEDAPAQPELAESG
jgi:hypothetical protein